MACYSTQSAKTIDDLFKKEKRATIEKLSIPEQDIISPAASLMTFDNNLVIQTQKNNNFIYVYDLERE